MTRRSKLIIAAVAAAVLVAVVVWFLIPVPLVPEPDDVHITSVRKYADGDEVPLTDTVDGEALAEVLGGFTHERFSYSSRTPIWTEVLDCRIDYESGGNLLTVTVGEDGVFLRSTGGKVYRVNDGERLAELIAEIIE